MNKERYYQIEERDDVSPLLWHRYFKPTRTRSRQGLLRGEMMCWNRPIGARVPPDVLELITEPDREAAIQYFRQRASRSYGMPSPYQTTFQAGLDLYQTILAFGSALNSRVTQDRTVYFLGDDDLTEHLRHLGLEPAVQTQVLHLWQEAVHCAERLTAAEARLFA